MPYIGNKPTPQNVGSDSITDGSIVNADINASAAIAISKLDGVTATNTELNILDGATVTTDELNILDGVTATTTELNKLDGYTGDVNDLNTVDVTTLGTVEASKVVTADANGDVTFPDGEKLKLGTSGDLEIFHDGSDSYIDDAGTGRLHLRGNDQVTLGKYTGENMVIAVADGQVELYYDSTKRIETTSVGADVTGELIADSYNETYVALSGTTTTVNCESGNVFALSTTGNTTFTFSNPPASGTAYGFMLKLTAGGTHTITYPASVDWAGGTAPDAPASGETDLIVFTTHDGGTTWYGALAIDAAG